MCKKCPDSYYNNFNFNSEKENFIFSNNIVIKNKKNGIWNTKRGIIKQEKINLKSFIKPFYIVVINYVVL